MLAQDERLAQKVGAAALVLLGGAIAFTVFLLDRIELGTPTRVRVYFAHSAGLVEHAPLVVAGRAIGRIESLEPVLHAEDTPLHGAPGVVARVAIDEGKAWQVPAGAEIFVASRGALSERYLEVAPPKEPGAPVTEGAQLRGADPPSLDTVLNHTWTNMLLFRAFSEAVRPEAVALREQVAQLAVNLDAALPAVPLLAEARAAAAEARRTLDTLGGDAGIARAAATLHEARATLAVARAALDRLGPALDALAAQARAARDRVAAADPIERTRAAIAQFRAVLDQVDPLLAKAEALADLVARGEGSLGRLMHDPEFPEDAKDLGKILKRQPWKIVGRPKD